LEFGGFVFQVNRIQEMTIREIGIRGNQILGKQVLGKWLLGGFDSYYYRIGEMVLCAVFALLEFMPIVMYLI